MLIPAKTLPKQALEAITIHRGRHLLAGDRKTEARMFTGSFTDQDGNTRVAASKIVLKDLLEILRSRKPQLPGKRLTGRVIHATG